MSRPYLMVIRPDVKTICFFVVPIFSIEQRLFQSLNCQFIDPGWRGAGDRGRGREVAAEVCQEGGGDGREHRYRTQRLHRAAQGPHQLSREWRGTFLLLMTLLLKS